MPGTYKRSIGFSGYNKVFSINIDKTGSLLRLIYVWNWWYTFMIIIVLFVVNKWQLFMILLFVFCKEQCLQNWFVWWSMPQQLFGTNHDLTQVYPSYHLGIVFFHHSITIDRTKVKKPASTVTCLHVNCQFKNPIGVKFLAHLAKGNVSFCHHLVSVVC